MNAGHGARRKPTIMNAPAPIDTTLLTPVTALDRTTIPAGTAVRFAALGDTVGLRAADGRGAKMPLALAQTALAALAVVSPAVTVEDLLDAGFAPARGANDTARVLPSHRPAKQGGDHIVTHDDLRLARNAAELCQMVGLDWRVRAEALQTADGRPSAGRSIRRMDTGAELSVESARYAVVQNVDALGVLDPVVAAGCPFVGAGWVKGGKKVFAQADLGRVSEVLPGDRMQHFIHVRAGHSSGSGGAIYVVRSDVRVVCRNTLARATSTGAKLFRVRHVGNATARVDDVRAAMEQMFAEIDAQMAVYREMAARPFTDADVRATLDAVLGTAEERAKENWRRDADALMTQMWARGSAKGAALAGRTAWGALNVVTEYADHTMAQRTENPEMAKVEGEPARLKAHAYDVILARAGMN